VIIFGIQTLLMSPKGWIRNIRESTVKYEAHQRGLMWMRSLRLSLPSQDF